MTEPSPVARTLTAAACLSTASGNSVNRGGRSIPPAGVATPRNTPLCLRRCASAVGRLDHQRFTFLRGAVLSVIALVTGCLPTVDTRELAPIDDYQEWTLVVTEGDLPAHGDTVRFTYVNDAIANWPGSGRLPLGSVAVKEVYQPNADGGAGDLDYIAVMRRLASAPPGGKLFDDWLFTLMDDRDADEKHYDGCWESCHAAAPYDGLFDDYGN